MGREWYAVHVSGVSQDAAGYEGSCKPISGFNLSHQQASQTQPCIVNSAVVEQIGCEVSDQSGAGHNTALQRSNRACFCYTHLCTLDFVPQT